MSSKWTLDMAAMQEDFFADTALVGIVSSLPIYKLCWMLNHRFDTQFVRDMDLDVCLDENAEQKNYFPIYSYCTPLNGSRYLIYKLKNNKESLLPEIKQMDYLWLIQSNASEEEALVISQYLRDIPDIQMAQILTVDKLKNINCLLI
ncbi:MAG: IPExxxVDY family protein [Bacteroidota bacterium]